MRIILVLLALAAALAYSHPIFRDFENWGIQDWDQHLFYHEVPRAVILRFGQIPLWNPYYCGGTVLLANPQSRVASPSFLCVLLFGAIRGVKLEIILHLIIGLSGAYALARRLGMSCSAALLSAALYMLNSSYALNLTVGMTWFMSVAYLPWVFLFYLRALGRPRRSGMVPERPSPFPLTPSGEEGVREGNLEADASKGRVGAAFMSGLSLALMFLNGGIYPLVITVAFLALYSLAVAIWERQPPASTALVFLLIAAIAFGLSAIKALPALEFMWEHPRGISDYSGYSLRSLFYSLFDRTQTLGSIEKRLTLWERGFYDGLSWFMDENGMYVGVVPALLFLLGLWAAARRRLPLALCLIIFLWLSFGNRAPVSLWEFAHRLPGFSSMRVAQRFRIVFLLGFSLFAGYGLDGLRAFLSVHSLRNQGRIPHPGPLPPQRRERVRRGDRFAFILTAAVAVDLILVGSRSFRDAFTIPPLPPVRRGPFFQILRFPAYDQRGFVTKDSNPLFSSWSGLLPAFLSNFGVIDAYETAEVPRRAIPYGAPGYRGEFYLDGADGECRLQSWSPGRFSLWVNARSPGYLMVNQNYYRGWRAEGGAGEPEERGGLIALKILPAGRQILLYYLPATFVVGSVVSGISILAGLSWGAAAWRRRRNQRRENGRGIEREAE